jgi:RNA-dependent RNA polymerase
MLIAKQDMTASLISFGFMHTETVMMVMSTIAPVPGTKIEFTLSLIRKQLNIKFPLLSSQKGNQTQSGVDQYRIQIPLSKLNEVYTSQHDLSKKALVIPLLIPPEFYRRTEAIEATHDVTSQNWSDWQTWFRQTDIAFDQGKLETAPVGFRKDDARIDIGNYKLLRNLASE